MMKETPTSGVSARDDDSIGSPAIKLFKPVTPRKLGIKCPASLRNRVQSTCLDDAAHLKTYMRLWVFVEVLLLFHDQFLIPRDGYATYVYPQIVCFALAFVFPKGWTFAAAFAARSAMYFAQMPAIWESNYWATFADLAFAINALAAPDRDVIRQSAGPVRTVVGLFYFGSGFWKMNTAFLSPKVSCACIYMASLFGMAPALPTRLVNEAIRAAPVLTAGGELLLGACLLVPVHRARRVGVVLAAILHFTIAITPAPNAVPAFGAFCMVRMFFALPEAWSAAISEALSMPSTLGGFVARLAAGAFVAASATFDGNTPPGVVDWALPAVTALCLLGVRAVTLDLARAEPFRKNTGRVRKTGNAALLTVVLFYVFAALPLGLMDISATSPFSQIRAHGGSNHLFMPMATHHEGGIVRVTYSTNSYLNRMYTGETSELLPPRSVELLEGAGHAAIQFMPTVYIVLGQRFRESLPHPFTPYTLPALELRRVLAEARAASSEPFVIEYDKLPGSVGNEKWRQEAVESTVRLSENGRGGRSCRIRAAGAYFGKACADDEPALLPPPSGWLAKIRIFFPLPVRAGLDELPCID